MKLLQILLLTSIVFCQTLHSQDLDKIMPEPVPKQVEPVDDSDPVPRISQEELDEMGMKIWATSDEEVLIPELKGVRLVNDPALVTSELNVKDLLLQQQGLSPQLAEGALIVVSAYLEKPVSEESANRMMMALRVYYSQMGFPFSQVYLPPQDITEGVLHFVIVESKLGQIRVEGNQYFSDQSYLSRIPVSSGDTLDSSKILAGIERINLNPFRDAAPKFAKGEEPGTADIIIQSNDSAPYRFFGGYNNSGTTSTTEDRLTGGINWGNALGRADQMTLQWTSDIEAKYSRALSTNYTTDLPGANSLTVFGAYSEIESKTTPDFDQAGESWQAGLNLDIPLDNPSERYNHQLQFGTDFKSSDNNLDFLSPPFVVPVVDNVTHIVQARLQYRGQVTDTLGNTSFGLKVTYSPGNVTSRNTDEAFEVARAGATADYVYGNFDFRRNTRLPYGLNWMLRGEVQQSSANLLGSEAFSGGGVNSVRGYEEGEVLGDNAFLVSQELQFPLWGPIGQLSDGSLPDRLQFFLFQDYAQLWNVDKLPGEETYELFSVGAGFNYQFTRYASLDLAYGWQLEETGVSSTGDDGHLHLSFMLSY